MTPSHFPSREQVQLQVMIQELAKLASRGRVGLGRQAAEPVWIRRWRALSETERIKLASFTRSLVPRLFDKTASWWSSLFRGAGAAGKVAPAIKGMDFIGKSMASIRGMSPLGKASLAITPAISGYQYYKGEIGPGEAIAGSLIPFGTAHLGLVPSTLGFFGAARVGGLADQLAGWGPQATQPQQPAPEQAQPAPVAPQAPSIPQSSLTPNQLAIYTGGGGVMMRPEFTMQGQIMRRGAQKGLFDEYPG